MSLLRHVPEIAQLVNEFKSKTLLDYGSGDGRQYSRERVHVVWGVEMPYCYDPRVPSLHIKPTGQFDGVICVDYLDTVAPDLLPVEIAAIAWHARKWAFVTAHGHGWHEKLAPFFSKDVRLVVWEDMRRDQAALNELHERTYGSNLG